MTDSASCSLMTFMPSGYNSRNLFAITYSPMYNQLGPTPCEFWEFDAGARNDTWNIRLRLVRFRTLLPGGVAMLEFELAGKHILQPRAHRDFERMASGLAPAACAVTGSVSKKDRRPSLPHAGARLGLQSG